MRLMSDSDLPCLNKFTSLKKTDLKSEHRKRQTMKLDFKGKNNYTHTCQHRIQAKISQKV